MIFVSHWVVSLPIPVMAGDFLYFEKVGDSKLLSYYVCVREKDKNSNI